MSAAYVQNSRSSQDGRTSSIFFSTRSPILRKRGTRKSRSETKTENEACSALLARLWCHLILQTPANRAENLTRLCSATICQTRWRMAQSGTIRSLLENPKHRLETCDLFLQNEDTRQLGRAGREGCSGAIFSIFPVFPVCPGGRAKGITGRRPRAAYFVNFINHHRRGAAPTISGG